MPGIMPLLLLAFIIVPLVELWAIGQVSGQIGLGWTIVILLLDSLAGAVLVRREGRRAWTAFRAALNEGRWPGDEVTQGALVLLGGALLLTPGFITDAVGLLAVLPPTRALASRVIRTRVTPGPVRMAQGWQRDPAGRGSRTSTRTTTGGAGPSGRSVMDVEVVSVERDGPPHRDGDHPDAGAGDELRPGDAGE